MTSKPSQRKKTITYKKAGVDIEAGYELVEKIKPYVFKTNRPEILSKLGAFSAISRIPKKIKNPLLVTCTDGVGTKIEIAKQLQCFDTIGIDLVAMCVNDLITCGAEPLLFLDYFVTDKLDIEIATRVIKGIADGCEMANCSLVGGETAEHPDTFPKQSFDLAGFALGVVDEENLIGTGGAQIQDILIGLPSSGIHANGFSLVRKILKAKNISLGKEMNGSTLGEKLLTPTRIYTKSILQLMEKVKISAIVNITGGGFFENIPRILQPDIKAEITFKFDDSQNQDLFNWIKSEAGISTEEMLSTFNCGIGMIISVKPQDAETALKALSFGNEEAKVIGTIKKKERNDSLLEFV
ncbi:MAG: phosphoribosylformylglycinamidine cyclo-ligase [Gammaproteobacteria bacterium]|nr:phosphoribosylformylglycinamidine cyclo-ligase [Gammaproteobacteria bacterium]|tara:strand:- start:212 stop:1270 length:1059 start_codon:yes stop_codon:yes gene_type:complete